MKFHPGQVSKLFYDFEDKYFDQLKNINVYNWSAWRIVKSSLYLDAVYISTDEHRNKEGGKKIKLLWLAYKSIFIVFRIFLLSLKSQKNSTVVITHTSNKIVKDSSGIFYDQIVDGLIVKSGIKNYVYIEIPGLPKENLIKPKIQAHFKEQDFKLIKIVIHKLFGSKRFIGNMAQNISSLFNDELKDLGLTTSRERLIQIISGFCVEYIFYRFLFKLFRPKLLITNDLMGSGVMAVARSLKIQSLELQHGLMDEYYPQYQMHPKFLTIKEQLPIANKIGVFGQFHKDQLVSKGFWQKNEVIIVGKFELPPEKNALARFSEKPTVLFITQGALFFNQSMAFLNDLLKNSFADFQLIIKLHPLEPDYCKKKYQVFEKEYSIVKLVQNEFNLNELFSTSDFVISYNSTVLIEAVAKGIASFTICDNDLKNGIYDLIGDNPMLENFLQKIDFRGTFIEIIKKNAKIINDKEFREMSNYLYETPYGEILKRIIY